LIGKALKGLDWFNWLGWLKQKWVVGLVDELVKSRAE
jgi:hypothetical protein